jgi:threonine dehydratase
VDRLRAQRPEVSGIVSATRGNHGQSLAFAGRAAGIAVTIVVPDGNSPDKNAAVRGFGRRTGRSRPRLPVGTRARERHWC